MQDDWKAPNLDKHGRCKHAVVVPRLRVGVWYFRVVRSNAYAAAPTAHLGNFSVQLQPCPGECSKRGSCGTFVTADVWYSLCQCGREFGGDGCEKRLVSVWMHGLHIFALVGSNLAMVPAMLYALPGWRQRPVEPMVFTMSMLASSVYHACDADWFCLSGYSYATLQFFDFCFAYAAIMVVQVSLGLFEAEDSRNVQLMLLPVIMVLVGRDPTGGLTLGLSFLLSFVAMGVGWAQRGFGPSFLRQHGAPKTFFALLKFYDTGPLWKGIACWLCGGISFYAELPSTYWLWHSTWHIFIMAAACLLMRAHAARHVKPQHIIAALYGNSVGAGAMVGMRETVFDARMSSMSDVMMPAVVTSSGRGGDALGGGGGGVSIYDGGGLGNLRDPRVSATLSAAPARDEAGRLESVARAGPSVQQMIADGRKQLGAA